MFLIIVVIDLSHNGVIRLISYCLTLLFPELALVTHKPRAASAYAVGTTKCAGK